MKLVCLITGIIFTLALLYLTFININTISKIDVSSDSIIVTNLSYTILCSGFIGAGIASSIWGYLFHSSKLIQKKQTRTVEKASIKAEESEDKVKALEAKIETLEKALQKALTK